jgi:hypothetical protein
MRSRPHRYSRGHAVLGSPLASPCCPESVGVFGLPCAAQFRRRRREPHTAVRPSGWGAGSGVDEVGEGDA